MTELSVDEGLYLLPSAAGAYYAASASKDDPPRTLLRALLRGDVAPRIGEHGLAQLVGGEDEQAALELLERVQDLGWIQGLERPRRAPEGSLEQILPGLLEPLSNKGRAMLADPQGFHLSSAGFVHELAEELSALSADLASLHDRHKGLLNNNLGIGSSAWSLVDAAGNGLLGCWPLYVGEQRFVLIVAGVPCFNQRAFLDLVWALYRRYA